VSISISPWQKETANHTITVYPALCRTVGLDEFVQIHWRKGALGIPWFEVQLADKASDAGKILNKNTSG